ncbi:MAG TPA: PepSY domain-containing protein [Methyloceanibacter sp.]|nr:PepSY domain-containing protein [Methyloceanibacter sp.]
MRRFLWIVLFGLSAAALPADAGAQHLAIGDVRNMAFDRGVVTIKEIELDDGIWEVQGRDASGHKIEMKVDAESGGSSR